MAKLPGDPCNTLLFRHKCHEDAGNDLDLDELTVNELTVNDCAHIETLEVDTITGFGGCDNPDQAPFPIGNPVGPALTFFINASPTIRDRHTLFAQTIQEVNGPPDDPPNGSGVTIVGDLYQGATGDTFYVKEIRDLDDILAPVHIPFIGTGLIDEAVLGAGIIVTGDHTQFYNSIGFGNPMGALFSFNSGTAAVSFDPQDNTAGVPVLNAGTFRFTRLGAREVNPLVIVTFGTSNIVMANAPFNFYQSTTAVIPVEFRPVLDATVPVATFRDVSPALIYQGYFVFLTTGFINFYNMGDDQGVGEGWFVGDNTKRVGIRGGSCTYEAAAS